MIKIRQTILGQIENNCYLITDEASGLSALVDCTDASGTMRAFLKGVKLKYILLTHGHWDHIGGVNKIKELTGARVIISKTDAPLLSDSRLNLSAYMSEPIEKVKFDTTVSEGDKIHLGGTEIDVIETPGHTDGSVCYLLKKDFVIFTGDTLFFCSCGRTDLPGGSGEKMLKSLKRLAKLDSKYKVLPGHGESSSIGFEKAHNVYMND